MKVKLNPEINHDEVLKLCKHLIALNDDPHPGLATWNEACQDAVQQLANELVGQPPLEVKPLRCDLCIRTARLEYGDGALRCDEHKRAKL